LKINIPAEVKVEVRFFEINLEMYFSEYAFSEVKSFSAIKPSSLVTYPAGLSRTETLLRIKAKNIIVEIYEFKKGVAAKKITSFLWSNSQVKVKINENEGNSCLIQAL
jgi:hypothetical protein